MKKIISLIFISMVALCSVNAQSLVEIKGALKKKKPSPVKLFKVDQGRIAEIANVLPSSDGSFGFLFKPDYKGYYLVGTGDNNAVLIDKYKLYVKGNEKINLELNDSTYVLIGENTKENEVLAQWYKVTYPLERKTFINKGNVTFRKFFPELENVANLSKTWAKLNAIGNADFDLLLQETVKYDLANLATSFIYSPRSEHPGKADFSDYYNTLDPDQFLSNTNILNYPYGYRLVRSLMMFKMKDAGIKFDFDAFVALAPNDTLKGEVIVDNAEGKKSYSDFIELIEKYKNYIATPSQIKRMAAVKSRLSTFKTGEKAINFTYPDINQKQVSLTDYKGKLVLVDVWATWCGPCKKEIPALKTLEKEFEGKDVVFMSVSVDEKKDAWDKFMKTENPQGVQLFANGFSQIAEDYKINAIPRFMLFDRKGNIISVDSPRPSDPRLKETLLEWLNK